MSPEQQKIIEELGAGNTFGSLVNREAPATLTVVERIYWRKASNKNAEEFPSSYHRKLKSKEQRYLRELTVTNEWQKLDVGWVGSVVGLLLIKNGAGDFSGRGTQPSPQEIADEQAKVVEVSYTRDPNEAWHVLPGETMKALPTSADKLWLRCVVPAEVECTLVLIPA
jgi:hypothetical protein